MIGQRGIDHRGLVHDEGIRVDGVVLIFFTAALDGIEAQQFVERGGRMPGHLAQAPGCPAGGGRQTDALADHLINRAQRADERRLARSGAAGDHSHPVVQYALHDVELIVGEFDGQPFDDRGRDFRRLAGHGRWCQHLHGPQAIGDAGLGGVEGLQINVRGIDHRFQIVAEDLAFLDQRFEG